MPSETLTGRLINVEAQVSIENGPLLAVRGANPIASAAGQFARFGQTQPVTVTGQRGTVDGIAVLFVTSIEWASAAELAAVAADDLDFGGATGFEELPQAAAASKPKKKAGKKAGPKKRARKAAKKTSGRRS